MKLALHCLLLALVFVLTASAFAQSGHLLYSFDKKKGSGVEPDGGLIADANGNLYGVTFATHGNGGLGTVFELSPIGGAWTETTLYSFSYSEGALPGGNLVFDGSGNLYGTTISGGAGNGTGCSVRTGGCGTVYELSPQLDGTWTHTILHSFDHTDGAFPRGGLIFGGSGNLYGTTTHGGGNVAQDYGTVFELSPGESGWTLTTLHVFVDTRNQADGLTPNGNLVFDTSGNLYGTTQQFHYVFELSPPASPSVSGWTETLISIPSDVGTAPTSGLVIDGAGNLYGATSTGGTQGGGGVFELSPSGGGWTGVTLATFPSPYSTTGPLAMDLTGNLYGVMGQKCHQSCVAVFELSNVQGTWGLTPLMGFSSSGPEGASPNGGLLLDVSGNVYGTSQTGGVAGGGSAFEIIP